MSTQAECPLGFSRPRTKAEPLQKLNLKVLNPASYLNDYDYATEFKKVDLEELKADLIELMTTSQDWWPADYGHYGPFFIRMAWHSAGTYRSFDGRGGANSGNQRFAPLNSWPDNGNLDKARRLLWPIKKKYGKKISWADLMIYAANCGMESMGNKPFGFAGGRVDCWEPESDVYWGPETVMLAEQRYASELKRGNGDASTLEAPLAAVQMGLIYVNPEGPGGNCDPLSAAKDIRETFGRMAMNDEETVALIAGGHTYGKGHGAAPPDGNVGPAPEDASIEEQGFGWTNKFGTGKGKDTITSGLEGAWTTNPAKFDNGYFHNLFKYDWKLTKAPSGASLWIPTDPNAATTVPDAHTDAKHPPVMFTTDLALKLDPIYGPISRRFNEDFKLFTDTWNKAWYKLCHRDMGPIKRCLGSLVPEEQLWQDPVPPRTGEPLDEKQIAALKAKILASGVTVPHLVRTAWASACTHRVTDFRGGANGARIRLAPQNTWKVNDPAELKVILGKLEAVQTAFNADSKNKISLADVIVLGGAAAIEKAAAAAGTPVTVPFESWRNDASQEQTDVKSFGYLEPRVDAFRNHLPCPVGQSQFLVDQAHKLSLTAPQMAVLVAGMRVLNANTGGSQVGVLTSTPGVLTNDFFVNLLDMSTKWSKSPNSTQYDGKDRSTGAQKWKASEVDLVFGSNSELRAIAETYACDDAKQKFVDDFVAAWTKVMNLDKF